MTDKNLIQIALPLINEDAVNLYGKFPISQGNWDHMMKLLDVMKPALIAEVKEGESDE